MAKKMKPLDWIAIVLLIVGGINWGLAIWGINLVALLTAQMPIIANIIYGAVGLSAVYSIFSLWKLAK